jgi:hypothetical protein
VVPFIPVVMPGALACRVRETALLLGGLSLLIGLKHRPAGYRHVSSRDECH